MADSPNDLSLTELNDVRDIIVFSHDNHVKPVVLGEDRTPPYGQPSAYDDGPDGWLSIPNNVSRIEAHNATLRPDLYGLDFWESLEGQLVTVPSPVAANFPDRFGAVWVYGAWPVSGLNDRGGLTVHFPGKGNRAESSTHVAHQYRLYRIGRSTRRSQRCHPHWPPLGWHQAAACLYGYGNERHHGRRDVPGMSLHLILAQNSAETAHISSLATTMFCL